LDQKVVSTVEFAKAMREAGGSFAEKVEQFESRFGVVSGDLLGVLAQAAFLCWHNVEIRRNLFALCAAIQTGRPTAHYYHCQITARRWNEMHTYLMGIQRWLGVKHALPPEIDPGQVEQIGTWLGERAPVKQALTELLLIRLVDDLLNYMSFAHFEGGRGGEEAAYSDFSTWYRAHDGTPYAVARTRDDSRGPFADPLFSERADKLADLVRESMSSLDDAEQLISSLKRQTQPPCMHRLPRYLDVQITSIGALKWRGNLPPDHTPKAEWQAFTAQAQAALKLWAGNAPESAERANPDNETERRVYAALGVPTELKQSIVRDFVLCPFWDVGVVAGWTWLVQGAQTMGSTAYSAFHLDAFEQDNPATATEPQPHQGDNP
jgi:hypothetical protein